MCALCWRCLCRFFVLHTYIKTGPMDCDLIVCFDFKRNCLFVLYLFVFDKKNGAYWTSSENFSGSFHCCLLLEAYYIHVELLECGEGACDRIGYWGCRHAQTIFCLLAFFKEQISFLVMVLNASTKLFNILSLP